MRRWSLWARNFSLREVGVITKLRMIMIHVEYYKRIIVQSPPIQILIVVATFHWHQGLISHSEPELDTTSGQRGFNRLPNLQAKRAKRH